MVARLAAGPREPPTMSTGEVVGRCRIATHNGHSTARWYGIEAEVAKMSRTDHSHEHTQTNSQPGTHTHTERAYIPYLPAHAWTADKAGEAGRSFGPEYFATPRETRETIQDKFATIGCR